MKIPENIKNENIASAKRIAENAKQIDPDIDVDSEAGMWGDAMMRGAKIALRETQPSFDPDEMWDKYSEHIEDSSFSFQQVAGTSVITHAQAMRMFNDILKHIKETPQP